MNVTFDELYMVIGVKVVEIAKLQTRLDALAADNAELLARAENKDKLIAELQKAADDKPEV